MDIYNTSREITSNRAIPSIDSEKLLSLRLEGDLRYTYACSRVKIVDHGCRLRHRFYYKK